MWLMLVLTLPTANTAARMRAWRALKALGAAVLRDGVYLLPEQAPLRAALQAVADDVQANGGSAHLLRVEAQAEFDALFDRGAEHAELLAEVEALRQAVDGAEPDSLATQTAALRKRLDQLQAIDHLPGEASRQSAAAMDELHARVARRLQPGEPQALAGEVPRRERAAHRGRTWVTRERPWVDRLASAWLIRRFIDPEARLLWLADPRQAPAHSLGYDYDGATFSHVGARVTFETLLAAFELETPALRRLGALVHRLDAGGAPVPEADGVERVLAGMRSALHDDDQLFLAAAGVFEGLWTSFEKDASE
ncbi:MAG: chromate resistance protein [Burkholderiales bacterium]|nr:chromate resistance protein [Burkholderiales bacterium]